jgi:hypothetical protein
MTQKIYRTARGKTVDVGAIRLQNEQTRAVGNMGVNARGDRIDSLGNVIDSRNQQIQRRINRQTNVSSSSGPAQSSARVVAQAPELVEDTFEDELGPMDSVLDTPVEAKPEPVKAEAPAAPIVPLEAPAPVDPLLAGGGLAAAIARAKTVKQELEKTPKQILQDQGVRKL